MEGLIIVVIVAGIIYLVPTWIAIARRHRYTVVIFALNLFGGWFGLGWIAAFVWAVWPSGTTVADVVTHDPTGLSPRNLGTAVGEMHNEYNLVRIPPTHTVPNFPLVDGAAPPAAVAVAFDVASKSGIRSFMPDSLPCVIGSGPEADIRIRHPSVSGQHVIVRSAEGGIVVTATADHSSLWVGGVPVRRGNVSFGSSFKIGKVTLRVRMAHPDELGSVAPLRP